MRRRDFITLIGSASLAPLAARAQQPMPLIGFLNGGASSTGVDSTAAFRKGLGETGLVEGRSVAVEYHWFGGEYDRVPALISDLIRRRVAVIVSPGFPAGTLAAKAATTTNPDCIRRWRRSGQAGSGRGFARPGGNVTGINFFVHELITKRLGLMRELIPKAVRHCRGGQSRQCSGGRSHDQGSARGCACARDADCSYCATPAPSRRIDAVFSAIARERARCPADWRRWAPQQPSRSSLPRWRRATGLPSMAPIRELRRGRRPDDLRDECPRHVSPGRHLCRPHREGRKTGRPSGSAIDQVRIRDQLARPREALGIEVPPDATCCAPTR